MDISHGIPFASPMKIYAGDYDDGVVVSLKLVKKEERLMKKLFVDE